MVEGHRGEVSWWTTLSFGFAYEIKNKGETEEQKRCTSHGSEELEQVAVGWEVALFHSNSSGIREERGTGSRFKLSGKSGGRSESMMALERERRAGRSAGSLRARVGIGAQ
jgi:hypothetical protein